MIFFRFSKNSVFWVFLVHPTVVSVLLSTSVEGCFVSGMRDFSLLLFLREGSKKNSKCKLFQKGGGGTPKFTFS